MLTSLYLPVVNEDCGGVETSKLVVDEVLIEEWQFLVVSQYTGVDHFTSQNTTLFHKEVNSVLPLPNVCWLLVSDSCNGEKMGRKWTSFGNIVFLQFQLNESPYVYRVQSKPTPVGFIFEKSTQHLAGWANRWRTWGSKMKGLTGEASVPLQETNISHLGKLGKSSSNMPYDMLIPRRVLELVFEVIVISHDHFMGKRWKKAVGTYFRSMLNMGGLQTHLLNAWQTSKSYLAIFIGFVGKKHAQFAYFLIFCVGRCGLTCSGRIARKPVPGIWLLHGGESGWVARGHQMNLMSCLVFSSSHSENHQTSASKTKHIFHHLPINQCTAFCNVRLDVLRPFKSGCQDKNHLLST